MQRAPTAGRPPTGRRPARPRVSRRRRAACSSSGGRRRHLPDPASASSAARRRFRNRTGCRPPGASACYSVPPTGAATVPRASGASAAGARPHLPPRRAASCAAVPPLRLAASFGAARGRPPHPAASCAAARPAPRRPDSAPCLWTSSAVGPRPPLRRLRTPVFSSSAVGRRRPRPPSRRSCTPSAAPSLPRRRGRPCRPRRVAEGR